MGYFLIYIFLFPFLKFASFFRKQTDKKLVIQNAVIGDYANTSVIFEPLGEFDIVLNERNLEFANYDERIKNKFVIDDIKNGKTSKIKFAFTLFMQNYNEIYVLSPNALNLFLAKCAVAKKATTISHYNNSSSFKFLSHKMQKIDHTTGDLTLLTYLKMLEINELKYEKCVQKPLFIPQNNLITGSKFKIGISLSAGNKMKTPPINTWNKIFEILAKFDCEVYIFGIKGDDKELKNIDTHGVFITSFIDKIALCELPFYTAQMNLYISADSGNYYIADTMKVPTICLMGPCFASEQRGVFNSLIVCQNLPPISAVFKTIRNIDASEYFKLSKEDEKNIENFIKNLVDIK